MQGIQNNSLKLFIISYPSHHRLAARPDCSPHSWPRWWHCLSFRPPFPYDQLFYHHFVWQTVCVFLRSAWRAPEETWTTPDYEGNASAMWWEDTWKARHDSNDIVTIATSEHLSKWHYHPQIQVIKDDLKLSLHPGLPDGSADILLAR